MTYTPIAVSHAAISVSAGAVAWRVRQRRKAYEATAGRAVRGAPCSVDGGHEPTGKPDAGLALEAPLQGSLGSRSDVSQEHLHLAAAEAARRRTSTDAARLEGTRTRIERRSLATGWLFGRWRAARSRNSSRDAPNASSALRLNRALALVTTQLRIAGGHRVVRVRRMRSPIIAMKLRGV